MSDGSVTVWLEQLKAGDPTAAGPLWGVYFARLVALARHRLGSAPRAAADEEDVALAAFDSFCRAAAAGRFPRLEDRDDLWQVLFMVTARKAAGLVRHEGRDKRGGGAVVHASAAGVVDASDEGILASIASSGPSPEEVAMVAEEFERLLGVLSENLRSVAILKMEGHTNAEIAKRIGRSVATVERKLADIRRLWEREAG